MFELDVPEAFRNSSPTDHTSEWLSLALQSAQMSAYKWDLKTNVVTRAKNSSRHSGIQEQSDTWMYEYLILHF